MNLYVYVLFQCMDWSGVVWIWRGVSLIVEGAMRSVRWDPTVVNHARVIQSDAYTDADTSFIHTLIYWRFIFPLNFTEIRKGSHRFRRTCWCHMSLFFEKKVWWIKSWNAYFVYMYSYQKIIFARHFWLGKSSLLFTDKILRRRQMYYDVTIDVMHVECSAYIWRISAFFVLNGLHLLRQVTKN